MNEEEISAMKELKQSTDFQRLLSNSILEIFNQFLRSLICEIWIDGDLSSHMKGFQFDSDNHHYEIKLEVKKETLTEVSDD